MIESPLLQNITGYAGGQWQQAAADTFDVDNPATGAVIAKVPFVTEQQVQEAIAAAKKADVRTKRGAGPNRALVAGDTVINDLTWSNLH
jgi:succinate-semialdehyde dehydrogenase/glutarate-semialdehyde dehydrogenase